MRNSLIKLVVISFLLALSFGCKDNTLQNERKPWEILNGSWEVTESNGTKETLAFEADSSMVKMMTRFHGSWAGDTFNGSFKVVTQQHDTLSQELEVSVLSESSISGKFIDSDSHDGNVMSSTTTFTGKR